MIPNHCSTPELKCQCSTHYRNM